MKRALFEEVIGVLDRIKVEEHTARRRRAGA
jgi:hypothetical protein